MTNLSGTLLKGIHVYWIDAMLIGLILCICGLTPVVTSTLILAAIDATSYFITSFYVLTLGATFVTVMGISGTIVVIILLRHQPQKRVPMRTALEVHTQMKEVNHG
jgi:hypothetical protein|tara:strand:- start:683 stop:1000 length:318 start_codon:yes stop_codon:yes gene_type:complete